MGISSVLFHRREHRRSLAILIARSAERKSRILGALKIAIWQGSSENRRRNRRESRDLVALRSSSAIASCKALAQSLRHPCMLPFGEGGLMHLNGLTMRAANWGDFKRCFTGFPSRGCKF